VRDGVERMGIKGNILSEFLKAVCSCIFDEYYYNLPY
jgi:hypothetical protein